MNAKYTLGIFLFVISLISCVKEEWDLGEKETEYSTIVEGTILSSNGMPLADINVKVDFQENKWLQYAKTRHKAEVKTDKNGKYRLHFQIKDDEQETDRDKDSGISKSYSLIFDLKSLDPKKYILPGDMYPTIISVDPPIAEPTKDVTPEIRYGYCPERSKTYTENLYIPQKRYIQVTLKGFIPQQLEGCYDHFEIGTAFPYGFEYIITENVFLGTKYGYGKVDDLFVLYSEEERTFNVPFALNENNIIKLIRRKNGVFSTEEHKLFVTDNSPKDLIFEY